MDASIARIRTPDELHTAAWGLEGCTYVDIDAPRDFDGGFYVHNYGDKDGQDCTTVDRSVALLGYNNNQEHETGDANSEGEDDAEWVPDDESLIDRETLESVPNADTGSESSCQNERYDAANRHYATHREALEEMYRPPLKRHPTHGTWVRELLYSWDHLYAQILLGRSRACCPSASVGTYRESFMPECTWYQRAQAECSGDEELSNPSICDTQAGLLEKRRDRWHFRERQLLYTFRRIKWFVEVTGRSFCLSAEV